MVTVVAQDTAAKALMRGGMKKELNLIKVASAVTEAPAVADLIVVLAVTAVTVVLLSQTGIC